MSWGNLLWGGIWWKVWNWKEVTWSCAVLDINIYLQDFGIAGFQYLCAEGQVMFHCARNTSFTPSVPSQFLQCPAYHTRCYFEWLSLVLKGTSPGKCADMLLVWILHPLICFAMLQWLLQFMKFVIVVFILPSLDKTLRLFCLFVCLFHNIVGYCFLKAYDKC